MGLSAKIELTNKGLLAWLTVTLCQAPLKDFLIKTKRSLDLAQDRKYGARSRIWTHN